MRFRLIGLAISLSFILVGCNLGGAAEPTAIPLPTEPSIPQVTILSPQSGATFAVNEQINVQVRATDVEGVTRVQLFSNGQIVRTLPSSNSQGDVQFEGTLDFTPRSTGEYNLRVIAVRGVVSSDPAEITVTVGNSNVQVTQRTDDNNTGDDGNVGDDDGGVVIPNDGVCRALVDAENGLNMRSLPTTGQENIVAVLPFESLNPVIARLGNNTWWKISFGGQIGWVSANFTTLYGNCLNIPVESPVISTPTPQFTNTPRVLPTFTPSRTPTPSITPTPGRPDLIVTRISGDTELVIPSGETQVSETYGVTVTNLGVGATGQFEVTMLFNNQSYDLGVIANLNPNESIALTRELTVDAAGSYNIRVDVDPSNAVQEISDVNNTGFLPITVTQQQ